MMLLSLYCSSQTAVQRDPDSNVSSTRTGRTQETVFFLVQKDEVVPSASWWVTILCHFLFLWKTLLWHCYNALTEPAQRLFIVLLSAEISLLSNVLTELKVFIHGITHYFYFIILCSQMVLDTTSVRVKPSTLASWSILLSLWSLWLSSVCLTTCLTGRTMTNMSCLLCLTWCGVLLFWRYVQA